MVLTPLSVRASMTRRKPSVSFRSASAALESARGAAVSNIVSSDSRLRLPAETAFSVLLAYGMWYTRQSQHATPACADLGALERDHQHRRPGVQSAQRSDYGCGHLRAARGNSAR